MTTTVIGLLTILCMVLGIMIVLVISKLGGMW